MNTNSLTNIILDSNSRFSPINENATILVENIASNVLYRTEYAKSKSNNSFSFSIDTTDMFIDRGVLLIIEKIPLLIRNLTNEVVGSVNNYNFASKVFGEYKDFILKQFSFLNAVDTISVNFGEKIITMNASELMSIVSNYYDKNQIHQFMDASCPDHLYSNLLHQKASGRIPCIGINNEKMILNNAVPNVDINNPFSAMVSSEYSTRRPNLELTKDIVAAAETDVYNGNIEVNLKNLNCYLPFNIFGINEEVPLYNIDKILVTVNLHNDFESRLFTTVPLSADPTSANYSKSKYTVKLNSSIGIDPSDVSLNIRLYSPPSDIKVDRTKPYIINYPLVELDPYKQDVIFANNRITQDVSSVPFDLRSIPKKMYISLRPKCSTSDDYLLTNEHYCRFNNLRIEFLGSTTELCTGNKSDYLYKLCKDKGLNKNKESLFLSGFPICIDVSDDLGVAKSAAKVGLNLSDTSGKYTVRISANVTRLHNDFSSNAVDATEANLFNFKEKVYELSVVFVYSAYLGYNLAGKKFSNIEYLSADTLSSINGTLDSLVQSFVPKANVLGSGMIGGNFFATAATALKGFANRGVNLVKAIIQDKDLRDRLIKASEGKTGGRNGVYSNIIGGSVEFDSHAPIMGAGSLSNWNSM